MKHRTVHEVVTTTAKQRAACNAIEELLISMNLTCMEAVSVLEAVKWELMESAK